LLPCVGPQYDWRRMKGAEKPLAAELSIYHSHKHEWLASHKEEFVLIGEGVPAGFYTSYEDALRAGLKRFGLNVPFLVKQVLDPEPVMVIY